MELRIDRILASILCAALVAAATLRAETAWSAPRNADMMPMKDAPSMDPTEAEPTDSTLAPHGPTRVVIRGVVRDANGGPVRGATIRLMSETDTVVVQSDATGRFRGRITAQRGVQVIVRAYGYRDLVRTIQASRTVIQAAFALPPPYPLGWVTITMAEDPFPPPSSRG